MYVVVGLFFGGILSLMSLTGFAAQNQEGMVAGMIVGAGAVVILPIFYGVMGFIGGIISALLYNGIASVAGGIEMNFEKPAGSVE